jgi:hypothetical protein
MFKCFIRKSFIKIQSYYTPTSGFIECITVIKSNADIQYVHNLFHKLIVVPPWRLKKIIPPSLKTFNKIRLFVCSWCIPTIHKHVNYMFSWSSQRDSFFLLSGNCFKSSKFRNVQLFPQIGKLYTQTMYYRRISITDVNSYIVMRFHIR